MTRFQTMICFLVLLFAASCVDESELQAARQRISQLETELAEKTKACTPPPTLAVPTPELIPPAPAEPSPTDPAPAAAAPEPEPTGLQWTYDHREDAMTGKPTHTAYVLSTNTVNFDFPYGGQQHGKLMLRTDPKYGQDVIFTIEQGQILCRSYEDCSVLVRFDDGKPQRFSGIGPADNSSETVFIRNYSRFEKSLRKSKIVRISVNVYQEGAPVFEFDVSGFNHVSYTGKK
jgi:hypothetical protein